MGITAGESLLEDHWGITGTFEGGDTEGSLLADHCWGNHCWGITEGITGNFEGGSTNGFSFVCR